MRYRRPTFFLVPILAIVLPVAGCGDDDPVAPGRGFALTVTVLDAAGQPLADEPVHVLPQLPPGILQDGKASSAVPAAVIVPVTLPVTSIVELEIRDVTGAHVRVLDQDHEMPAGRYLRQWNGRDDEDEHRYTGWYEAVLTCRDPDSGEVVFTDTAGLLMILLAADRTPWRTDASGKVTIDDRRVVPAFFEPPELRFTHSEGEVFMAYTLDRRMQIRAAGVRVDFEAVAGHQEVVVRQIGATGVSVPEPASPRSMPPPPPEDVFGLGDPYPNPFN